MSVAQNSLLSERLAILATMLPVAATAGGGTLTSGYVNIVLDTNSSKGVMFSRLLAVANVLTDGTTVTTVSIQKATDSSGSGAATLISQTVASTATPCVIFDINPFSQALTDTSKTYLAVKIVNTTGATGSSGIIIGGDGKYDPASYWNAAGVVLSTNTVL